jgi:guanylate cyclase
LTFDRIIKTLSRFYRVAEANRPRSADAGQVRSPPGGPDELPGGRGGRHPIFSKGAIMFYQLLTKTSLLLSQYAAEPQDSQEWRLKKTIGIATALVGIPTYLGYGLLYIACKEQLAGLLAICACVLLVLGLLTYRIFRNYAAHWCFWIITHALMLTSIHFVLGGFAQAGMVIVWLLIIPIETIVVYKPGHGLAWFLVVTVILLTAAFLQPYYLRTTNNIPPMMITALYVINTLGVAIFMLLAVYYYVWQNEILSQLVLSEQEKAEALLLNILPKEIATILKNENRVIANQFDGVSILFADVVNFTPMSSEMTPTELVELLNDVFSCFDTLVEKYGVEKIKTIGDCYMVAAGVPRPRSDHAHILTRLALDIRDYVSQHEFGGKRLTFRIGLNSGPVVAGVIGRKKFSYDLWGDTVNTASRMESHGTGGFVQITEATHTLIKDDFICESRGVVSVKGKGKMNVWYVLGHKA